MTRIAKVFNEFLHDKLFGLDPECFYSYTAIIMHYCKYGNLKNFLERILKKDKYNNLEDLEELIYYILFQVVNTFLIIKQKYPTFCHYDITLNNVFVDKFVNDGLVYPIDNFKRKVRWNIVHNFIIRIGDFGIAMDRREKIGSKFQAMIAESEFISDIDVFVTSLTILFMISFPKLKEALYNGRKWISFKEQLKSQNYDELFSDKSFEQLITFI